MELTDITTKNNQTQVKQPAPPRSASDPEISNSDSNERKSFSLCDLTNVEVGDGFRKPEEHDLQYKAASEVGENGRRVLEADSTSNQEGLVSEINSTDFIVEEDEETARENEYLQVIHIDEQDSISVQENLEMAADNRVIAEENTKLLEEATSDFLTGHIVQKPNCVLQEAEIPMEIDRLRLVEAQDGLESYVENAFTNGNLDEVTNVSLDAYFPANSDYLTSPARASMYMDPFADVENLQPIQHVQEAISVEVDIPGISGYGISQASKYENPLADAFTNGNLDEVTNISLDAYFPANSGYVISSGPTSMYMDPLADVENLQPIQHVQEAISVEVDIPGISGYGISQASKYEDPLTDVEKLPPIRHIQGPNSISAGFDTTSTSTYYGPVSADEDVQANAGGKEAVVEFYGQDKFVPLLADQTNHYTTLGLNSVKGCSEGLYHTYDLDQATPRKKTIRLKDTKYIFDNTTSNNKETLTKVNFQSCLVTVSGDTFKFERKCVVCKQKIVTNQNCMSWGTNEFCNEVCLLKYQKRIGLTCVKCGANVLPACLGKFCVRFGCNMQQFCGSICLRKYKQSLQLCCYCQSNLARASRTVVKLEDNGKFKELCVGCQEKYKSYQKPSTCLMCHTLKPITIEFEHNGEMRRFCNKICFGVFKYVNKIASYKCKMCQKFYDIRVVAQHTIFYENSVHCFCSKLCQNVCLLANRKIASCNWCKAKKYTLDMIRCHPQQSPVLTICSLSCFSLYHLCIQFNCKTVNCDYCHENIQQTLYYLTMSDGTIRSFCLYSCVLTFQQQFPIEAVTLNDQEATLPVPVGPPKVLQKTSGASDQGVVMLEIASPSMSPTAFVTKNPSNPAPTTACKQQLIIKQPPMAPQENKSTMCKLVRHNKSVNTKLDTLDKSIQTNAVLPKVIPIPVPIYVPTPVCMYSMPYPVPVPFPLPIPVPVFIPTTRNHYAEIMRDIQQIPANPMEKIGDDVGKATANPKEDGGLAEVDKEIGQDVSTYGIPSLWDIDELDVEKTVVTSPIDGTPENGEECESNNEMPSWWDIDDFDVEETAVTSSVDGPTENVEECDVIVATGAKRSKEHAIESAKKRFREEVDDSHSSPDANMCLKYMYGVNCWKEWIKFKNGEIAECIAPASPLNTELLDLSPYELNKLLCFFIEEIRKPNGETYAPDTIYYLCLGVQLYLNLNQRIDNLFCDFVYEAFTERLDKIAQVFSDTYSTSKYVITRVEEEHLWESKQLGAHSPHVLINTLIFFNAKYFNLKTIADHMNMAFSNIMKNWSSNNDSACRTEGVPLRLYINQCSINQSRKKKIYEQVENTENPLRCPVRLYEFYLSKCPKSVKSRADVFYLQPERHCVVDSPFWFSTTPLSENVVAKTLNLVRMVKEINIAFQNNT